LSLALFPSRTGNGIASSDHHRLFCGSESLFRPGYKEHLATAWISALEGVSDKLKAGAKVPLSAHSQLLVGAGITEGPASNPIGDDPGSRCHRYVSLVAV
jgi:hypothetical protein